jgi:hypothetical protein
MMLNMISGLETATEAYAGFGMGAVLPSGVRSAQPVCTGAALARPRPRALWDADVFGRRAVAGLDVALEAKYGQRNAGKQYPHTTRIAVPSGGAEGPHTAREPV